MPPRHYYGHHPWFGRYGYGCGPYGYGCGYPYGYGYPAYPYYYEPSTTATTLALLDSDYGRTPWRYY